MYRLSAQQNLSFGKEGLLFRKKRTLNLPNPLRADCAGWVLFTGDAAGGIIEVGESDSSLTNGIIYDVISVEKGSYRIVDNTGEDYLFDENEFEIIE